MQITKGDDLASNFNTDDEPISTINVTPFVDIILVVLIIFMLTSSLIISPSIMIELPKAGSGEEMAKSILNISINPEGAVFLNGENTSSNDLAHRLQSLSLGNPEMHAVISADKSVSHGVVISVMDSLKKAGVNKVAMSVISQ